MRNPKEFSQDQNIDRFVEVCSRIDEISEEKSDLEKEKKAVAAELAKQFGESATVSVTRGGYRIQPKKFLSCCANEGLRAELIDEMQNHEETADMVKPNFHAGNFSSWVRKHDEFDMMTPEELLKALPKWMQDLVHINSATVAVATKVKTK